MLSVISNTYCTAKSAAIPTRSMKGAGNMDTQQLRTFVNLAQTLNYAATARALHITQPAVTQQIENLERYLGARLFDRNTRKVELTAAGKVFFRDCIDIVSRIDQAKVQVKEHARAFESTMRVACSSNMDVDYMPRLLARYRAIQPNVHLYISHGNPVNKLAALGQDKFDVLLSARNARGSLPRLSFKRLAQGRFSCILPAEHPLAMSKDPLRLSDLHGEHLIFLEDEVFPPEMADVQNRISCDMPDTVAYYSGSALISAVMIEAGMGLAIMPDFACPKRPEIIARPLIDFAPIEYGIFWNTRDTSEKTAEFIRCATEVYQEKR